jgi:glycosyltransferase involved in cell wall biosynthesis
VAVLEALASETPVICSSVGACPELVADGNTGMLIPVGDAPALVEAIKQAFSGMRFDTARGRKLIVENYDMEVISARLRMLYSHLAMERLS